MKEGLRLQRFLAEAGIAARRKVEALIVDGRVRVNGRVAELGSRVDPERDKVEVDGRPVRAERKVYLLLHKPRGYVSTLDDPEGRPTVMELLPKQGPRIYPVGRLDFNTEGLLLFTNDGDLANGLMHPRREVTKTYHVKLRGVLTEEDAEKLQQGVELDGALRKAHIAGGGLSEGGKHSWIELSIHEGRNRQVHRMMEAIGHEVSRLVRVGYAGLTTHRFPRGSWRHLTKEEVAALGALAGVERGAPREAAAKETRKPAAAPARKPTRAGPKSRIKSPPKGSHPRRRGR